MIPPASPPPLEPAAEAFAPDAHPIITLPVIGARAGVTVEFAPGKRAELKEADPLERFCVAELVPLGGGTYRVVPRVATAWLRFSRDALAKLGIGLSENTMHRLGRAEFIRVRQVSPACYEFHLGSWLQHCAAVEADPEFWDKEVETRAGTRTNRRRYNEAI